MSLRQSRRAIVFISLCGVALLALAGEAAADPYPTRGYDLPDPRFDGHGPGVRGNIHGGVDYDVDRNGVLDHQQVDLRYFDRDRDGVLDRRERRLLRRHLGQSPGYGYGPGYVDPSVAHVREHDTNRDGILDAAELRSLRQHDRMEAVFASYDRNHDRVLSWGEVRGTPLRLQFAEADFDRDGHVTWDELEYLVADPRSPARYDRYRSVRDPGVRVRWRWGD